MPAGLGPNACSGMRSSFGRRHGARGAKPIVSQPAEVFRGNRGTPTTIFPSAGVRRSTRSAQQEFATRIRNKNSQQEFMMWRSAHDGPEICLQERICGVCRVLDANRGIRLPPTNSDYSYNGKVELPSEQLGPTTGFTDAVFRHRFGGSGELISGRSATRTSRGYRLRNFNSTA
jgi:hypothetical protein